MAGDLRELPPLAELEQWLELRRDFEAAVHAALERPSAEDITLAEEALAWPVRYLADAPLQRDAVWLTVRMIAFNLKLEKLLRERRIAADLMVEARKAFAPDIVRIYEDDAQEAAAKVVAWANAAFANVSSRSKIIRIKQGARIRFKREIRKAKAIERITHVRRGDVMPGKLFNQSRVHHHRIAGVEAIIAGLIADRVKVR